MQIGMYRKAFETEEPKYEDFISRRDFINATGVFVTPNYFDGIYDDFKESGVQWEEFVRDYEEKYSTCIQEFSADGDIIKFEFDDQSVSGLDIYESDEVPNVLEVLNSLSLENYQNWMRWGHASQVFANLCKEYERLGEAYKRLCKEYGNLWLEHDETAVKVD